MIIFLPPKIVVPIILIHSTLLTTVLLVGLRGEVDLKRIWPLIVAGIIGVPFGTYLLIGLDENISKIFIGSVIILCALAFLKGFKRKIKNEKLAFVPVGFISGLLSGSAKMGGPPVIFFFTNQGMNKQAFRANIIAYFMALSLVTLPSFILGGLITIEVIKYTTLFLPAMIFGVIIGTKLVTKVKENLFQDIALAIVIIAGLLSIVSSLCGYF